MSSARLAEGTRTAMQRAKLASQNRRRWSNSRRRDHGKEANIVAISKAEDVDRSYVSRMVNLTTLTPELQAAILDVAGHRVSIRPSQRYAVVVAGAG